ncbi:hypothetical protein CPC08DRAFT_608009, partial [Agrocybe pediades]
LKRHNPIINWQTGQIDMVRCPEECGRNHHLDKGVLPELRIFATGSKSAEIAAEHIGPERTFEEMVTREYHEYRKVFEEDGFQELPKRRPWDHAIEIKE